MLRLSLVIYLLPFAFLYFGINSLIHKDWSASIFGFVLAIVLFYFVHMRKKKK